MSKVGPIILFFALVLFMVFQAVNVSSLTVQNMEKIYQLTESKVYSDSNVFSYDVEWYYASGFVNGQLYHYFAGFVREIPDASNGNSNERWYVEYFDPNSKCLHHR